MKARYPLSKSVALRLLRCYPRPWRTRYLAEMQALLEEMPVGWTQTANVAAIAMREWLSPRALGWPARSATRRVLTARAWLFFGVALGLDVLAWVVSKSLTSALLTVPMTYGLVGGLLSLIFWARVLPIAMYSNPPMRTRHWLKRYPLLHRPLSGWQLAACAALLFPSLVEFHVSGPEPNLGSFMLAARPAIHVMWLAVYSLLLMRSATLTWRLKRVEKSRSARCPVLHLDE